MATLYIFAAIALVAIVVIVLFNQLIAKRQMVNNGWADIDVQLKRRADLIPQLVTTVQAYAAHERSLFEEVAERRNAALAAGDNAAARGAAESELSKPVGRLIALGEAYPDLKANQNFMQLQEELTSTENKIGFARQHYNRSASQYNEGIAVFPANMVAGMFNFTRMDFFEVQDSAVREAPKVQF